MRRNSPFFGAITALACALALQAGAAAPNAAPTPPSSAGPLVLARPGEVLPLPPEGTPSAFPIKASDRDEDQYRSAITRARFPLDKPCAWIGTDTNTEMFDAAQVTSVELRAIRKEVEAIRQFIASAPVMNPAIGFCPWINSPGASGLTDHGYALQAHFTLNNGRASDYELTNVSDGDPYVPGGADPAMNGTLRYHEPWPLNFFLNKIPVARGPGGLESDFAAKDARGPFFVEPQPTHVFQGFPVYRRHLLVIARHDRPLYRPVTLARVLAWRIADLERQDGGAGQSQAALLRARLTDLSPAQSAAQACLAGQSVREGPMFTSAGAPDCAQRLVEPNADYYDKTLPRTAVQLLTVDNFNETFAPHETRPSGGRPGQRYIPLWANGHTMWGLDWQRYRREVMQAQ